MYETIRQLAHTYHHETIQCRRHIHQYAESGWLEMKTACLVAQQLQALGYEVKLGQEIMNKDDRMGLPGQDIFDQHYLRAQQEGAPLSYLQQVKDGMTAVAGILKNGSGPVVAMRFDMDALGLDEDTSAHHFPASHHFISCHQGVMHACGHDGHTAIGLTTAKILMELKDHWNGTLKLIFQPAEEGVRGARSICTSHFLDDVDYIFAGIGTGGTITGIGQYVRDNKKDTKVIGVEPESSPLLTKGRAAPHKIQGIGANFVPEILDLTVISRIIDVSNDNAINTAREICFNEGLYVGISSGASVYAAIDLSKELNETDKKIKMLCILPDTGERYSWN